ncbi:MAG: 30S ribosomal protein S13 [Candidatus Pacebacteria bacterium]|nr:30S ribosomal protein S13 [Candidatus Paceibacterota bacterium]MCD8507875.1 30S ribosomal protein S13 [Candidatus Paceibacterota bacterium]MCD8563936.1 30S ribosomal protein S13 [Candidatus Paceibacterota bacterium]
MRISGITIPDNKRVKFGLTEVYGIGVSLAEKIAKQANVDAMKKVSELSEDEEVALRTYIEENLTIEGDLKRQASQNIKRLKDIQAFRGARHMRGLPVRGQRTKTNSRTVRGNKRNTMGSGRRKVEKT